MKYLLVLAVVMAVVWYLRNNRPAIDENAVPAKPGPLAPPQDMVRCPICSVHLPRSDARPGRDGRLYCCAEHGARSAG